MIKCRVYKIILIFYFNLKIYIISTEVCGSFLPQRDKSDNASDFDLNLNILFIFFSVIESEEQSPLSLYMSTTCFGLKPSKVPSVRQGNI